MSRGLFSLRFNICKIIYSQSNKPFIVLHNVSGQATYGGFLIDLMEALSETANVRGAV